MRATATRFVYSLFCLLLLGTAAGVTGQESSLRVWNSKAGTTLEAELQSASPEAVVLKPKEGEPIEVPVSALSAADMAYLRDKFPELYLLASKSFATAVDLQKAALRRRHAADALAMYDSFLADPTVASGEKAQAKGPREEWVAWKAENKLRVGTHWLSPEQHAELVEKESKLLERADNLLSHSDLESVRKALKDATNVHPLFYRANFRLGLLEALHPDGHSAKDAKRYFSSCKRCMEDCLQDLTDLERADLAACYNNLALSSVRQGEIAAALALWSSGLKAVTPQAAVLHNLAHLTAEATRTDGPRVALSKTEQRKLEQLCDSARISFASLDRRRGWRYMPLAEMGQFNPKGHAGWSMERSFDDSWCMGCGGLAKMRCPERCDHGFIKQFVPMVIVLPNKTGTRVVKTPVRVECKRCNADGVVDCPHCDAGYDKRYTR